jgi:probable rRNA maturation factor
MSHVGAASGEDRFRGFEIAISDDQQSVAIDHDWLRQIARDVLQEEGIAAARISVALVDDLTIHEVNRKFLAHDYPTDVISFLLDEKIAEFPPAAAQAQQRATRNIDGEVVISGDTAARTAGELGCPAKHETALYLVHGLLHLCGYDDQSDADREQMRLREQWHLQKSGIVANYDC